jgi:hypothetical protein
MVCNESVARPFGALAVLIRLAVGGCIWANSTASTGTGSPKTTVNLDEVQTDLLRIAQAKRGCFALEGKYPSLAQCSPHMRSKPYLKTFE